MSTPDQAPPATGPGATLRESERAQERPPPHELPNRLPRPPDELKRLEAAWEPPKGLHWFSAVNNSQVGLMYIATALLFFVLAGVLALVMRTQLAVPDNTLLSPGTYNQLFTMHGTVMMFLFAVPMVEAIAVYLLPNMLGARDLPFPRLSAYAFWAYAVGGLVFFGTVFFGASPDGGWFMYPPLTGTEYSPSTNADWWLLGIGFIEISAIAGAIELIIGILMTRAPGMSLGRMPIYAWSMLVVGFMIVFAFPAIIAGTLLLEMERAFDWPIFNPERGGDPVLWQHLFWFFGHPEVYIIFLPAAGMVSMMVPVVARTPLVAYRAVVVALVAVGFFSFALWAHHMFTAGLGILSLTLISAASMAVAIPSGIQVFAWIATLWRGRVRMNSVTLFLIGFLFIFVLGGLTGVMVAVVPFDWQVHDSYFVVAHFHYVLIGGMVFPMFAALYYWLPLVNGNRLSERLAKWVFGALFVGFNLGFFPMHISGILGMPRRVYTYADGLGLNLWNALSTAGAFLFAAGVAAFLVDLVRTLRQPSRQHDDPWESPTMEWLPNESYGTRSIPQVDDRDPLWRRPSLSKEVESGQHWLPGTVTGQRETLITSPVSARILHLTTLPGDGWRPFIAALGTAGFFLLLTVKMMVPAFVCGLIAIVAIVTWLWESDRAPPAPTARIGEQVEVPIAAEGASKHAWWAMVLLLIVDGTVFASMLFAHIHVSMRAEVCPPPGAALPAAQWPLLASALLLAGSAALAFARRRLRSRATVIALAAFGMACVTGAFASQWGGHLQAGLQPSAEAWSATVGAMLAYQGLHVGLLLLMGGYLVVRAARGLLHPRAAATLDSTALMWHYVTAQGLVLAAAVNLLPGWMN